MLGVEEGEGWAVLLLPLEVEPGEGLFGLVGEADGLVCLQCRAEEPAGTGGRLEAGGGADV